MLRVISLGAGVQSTTMALMAAHGEIGPMPDCAIFADTQAEPISVYEHLGWLRESAALPFPIHTVTHGNLAIDGSSLRVSGKSHKTYLKTLIPLFIANKDGTKGILGRKCTSEYKVRVLIKKLRQIIGPETIRSWRKSGGKEPLVEQWLGISMDESWRMKPASEPWIVHRWPLVERGITRQDCLIWMERKGYPRPPRSACVFCPYHNDGEWRRLRDQEPQEFARAVAFEKKIQAAAKFDQVMRGIPFLHSSLVPLEKVDLRTDEEAGQLNLFNNECEGMCGV